MTRATISARDRASTDEHYFYVPKTFDALTALPAARSRYADCAHYLLDRVVTGNALRHYDEDGFVRLKVEYLRRVIPDRCEKSLRQSLIRSGVLEHDPHYERGVMAMGYRLGEAYRHAGIRRVTCTCPKVASRIRRLKRTLYRTDTRIPVHRYLKSSLNHLSIDADSARQIVLSTPRLLEHADIHMTAIDMIADGHQEFSHCQYGRVHTLITRLPRELRPTLRLDNQTVINIDIANSQPQILATLINPTQPTTHNTLASTTQGTSNTMSILGEGDSQLAKTHEVTSRALRRDEMLYVELCERGIIYDYLQEKAGLSGLTREKLKRKFYIEIFYGRNQIVTDFTRLFERTFPSVMEMIRKVKRPDHTVLACEMQRRESRIVIHGVCRRLMEEYPHVPIITIHDSILTTAEHAQTVRDAMLREFALIGMTPTLKVEDFGRQVAGMAA